MDKWKPIETAPKDGRAVLLLSAAYDDDCGPNGMIHHAPKVAIGRWDAEGTSWVQDGPRHDDECMYHWVKTGVWLSGGGWFELDEVTHWTELPPPDATASPSRRVSKRYLKWKVRHQARQIKQLSDRLRQHSAPPAAQEDER